MKIRHYRRVNRLLVCGSQTPHKWRVQTSPTTPTWAGWPVWLSWILLGWNEKLSVEQKPNKTVLSGLRTTIMWLSERGTRKWLNVAAAKVIILCKTIYSIILLKILHCILLLSCLYMLKCLQALCVASERTYEHTKGSKPLGFLCLLIRLHIM